MSTLTTATYGVDGMTCEHCVRVVTTEVGAIPGVRDVRVDLTTGEVSVDSTHPLDPTVLQNAVQEAGYGLR